MPLNNIEAQINFPNQNQIQYLNRMSKKALNYNEQPQSYSRPLSSLPQTLRLKPLQNNYPLDINTLRARVEELQSKVEQLQTRMRSKRKRIRRKASEVDKKYKCDFCKKLYGSLVSLNLHLRIKHKKQKAEKDEREGRKMNEKEGQSSD